MKVIISHQNIDFDGLASMVACSKLYPEAKLYFTGSVSDEVKKLMALYKHVLSIPQAGKLDLRRVRELYIVDVDQPKRIGRFKELIETGIPITVFDHHPAQEESIPAAKKIRKQYGACVTILLEEIRQTELFLTPFEATLMLLGIYADTGCLTYPHTTWQDADGAAYLLKQGAQLKIMNEFLKSALDPFQDQLLIQLLNRLEEIEVNGYQIAITTLESDEYISDLAILAEKIIQLRDCHALFFIAKMEDQIYIVGRSQEEKINIPLILESFGGKGHHQAASASVKTGDMAAIRKTLLHDIHQKIKPQPTAREIMSYPVKTIHENMTMDEVHGMMLRYGHTGLPVVKDHRLIGIISRTDVDKAVIHHLSHAPVKGFMTREVKCIEPDTPLTEISDLLIQHNIGRLPVLEQGEIIGIVTRTELLKVLHGENHPYWYKENFEKDLVTSENYVNLTKKLEPEVYKLLQAAGTIGDQLNSKVFVVGGFVRDLLLNRENFDIDIVLEGDGIGFARRLAELLNGSVKEFPQFGTALITLTNGQTLDIVTARSEYYEYPAALPKVEKSSIWSDLFRRDFTINCLAIQLNQPEEGKLIDYFGGMKDLKNKKLRVLYNLSFIEDPTRIFRAIRFASRLSFEIEQQTGYFMAQSLNSGMLKNLSDDRIREELLHILREPALLENVKALDSHGVFHALHPQFTLSQQTFKKLEALPDGIKEFSSLYGADFTIEWIVVLFLLGGVNQDVRNILLAKFVAQGEWIRRLQEAWDKRPFIYEALGKELVDSVVVYELLHGLNPHVLLYYDLHTESSNVRYYLRHYVLKLKDIQLNMSGKELLALNIRPGPIYKQILDKVLAEKIKGSLHTIEEELRFAQSVYEKIIQEGGITHEL